MNTDKRKGDADYLFESSWEVCNKVGGINTVLISKAALMGEYYDNYFLVGPYFKDRYESEVLPIVPPEPIRRAFDAIKGRGIRCWYGTWQIRGEPPVILVDFSGITGEKNQAKTDLWSNYGVESLFSGWEFEEPLMWSWAVGILLQEIEKNLPGKRIVGHFHEWLAGFSLLYLKMVKSSIRTVFTTHATILGRSIAGGGRDLYSMLDRLNPAEEAKACNVTDKFTAERAAAQNANVFTTVSEITGMEAEKILGRRPEILVLNGLSVDKFPTIEETSIKHVMNRDLIREYLTYHFFPHYTFDMKSTLIFYLLGRGEFKNKGIDVTIQALGRLNELMKKDGTKKTVCVFIWVPNRTYGIKTELLENKNVYRHIKSYIELKSRDILDAITEGVISQDENLKDKILTRELLMDLKKELLTFKRSGNPLMVTHNIPNEGGDIIINALRAVGIENRQSDRVKAIVYPVYIDGNDGLLNLSYYEAMAGCHLGIFPSYYEPWGYTPLESAAMGVPAVTTDLAGFGRFIKANAPQKEGIFILDRFGKSDEEVVRGLTDIFYGYTLLDHAQRVQNKIYAKNLSYLADWKHLVKNYIQAHDLALR